MTTIGKVAYMATFDASQLVRGLMSSRQQFSAHKKIVEQSQSPLQKYETGLANLRTMVSRFPDLLGKQKQLQGDLNRQYLEAEQAVRKLTAAETRRLEVLGGFTKQRAMSAGGHFESTWPGAKGVAAGAGASAAGGGLVGGLAARAAPMLGGLAVGYAAKRLVTSAVGVHASIERSTAAMEVFTGSAAKAARMMGRMRDLSTESGIGFDAMQKAASTMMSFGVATDRTLPALRQMAEITRGDTERLGSLSLAFAQSAAAGKLMGQDLLQMVNAGFNPLLEISRKTGKSIGQLRDEMSAGKIGFNQVAAAFESATAAGGKFNGMMEQISKTSAGSLSRVSAEWSVFLDKFGTSVSPATKSVSSGIASSLSILSTVFSQWDDAVDRRMKAAKKTGGTSAWSDFNIFGMQSQLSKSAALSNELDAKLEKSQEKYRKFEKMKKTAQDFAAPGPTEAQRVKYMERQLELIEKQKAAQQKLQDMRKAELDQMRDRAKQLEKSLESPVRAYRRELADLILMRRRGLINQETMLAGANAAAGQLPGTDIARQEAPRPSAMRAGSEELLRYLTEKQREAMGLNKKGNVEESQLKAQQDLNFLTQQNTRVLQQIRDGLPKFGSDG